MRCIKVLMVPFGMVMSLLLGIACSDDGSAAQAGTTEIANLNPGTTLTTPVSVNSISSIETRRSILPAATLVQTADSQYGIWVTGQGVLNLEPDLALVNIGVETQAVSVEQARTKAANAMDSIIKAIKDNGLTDRDIKTVSFNIHPQYEFTEVSESGRRVHKQILIGYTVSNTASIKVRNLDNVGTIIDDVVNAGGDSTRINGITFTVEYPKPFMSQLREEAVEDAVSKAEHLARLSGVEVGTLVFISESDPGTSQQKNFGPEMGFARALSAPAMTSIRGGELELTLSVQTVFAIR